MKQPVIEIMKKYSFYFLFLSFILSVYLLLLYILGVLIAVFRLLGVCHDFLYGDIIHSRWPSPLYGYTQHLCQPASYPLSLSIPPSLFLSLSLPLSLYLSLTMLLKNEILTRNASSTIHFLTFER